MNHLFFSNLLPGTRLFKRFDIVHCINAGDVGAVYLCRDVEASEMEVALKVIDNNAAREAGFEKRFRREMMLACQIDHPFVVKSRSFYRDEDFTAFTMEYVNGGTLADLLRRDRVGIDKTAQILHDLALGLAEVHDCGVLHRDLKPENILIDSHGTPKIADFGIASSSHARESDEGEGLIGSVHYMSPEYIAHGVFDARSDIFSLGVIAYEMIAGSKPFDGADLIELLAASQLNRVVPIRERCPECPAEIARLVSLALNPDPDRRPQSAMDFLGLLKAEKRKARRPVQLPRRRPLPIPAIESAPMGVAVGAA